MGKNVGEVAAQAVKKSEKVKASERTGDQILLDIRRNIAAHLAVTPDDVRFLLSQYDKAALIIDIAVKNDILKTAEIAALEAKIEEFRSVYEQENRRTTLRVDVRETDEQTDEPASCGTLTDSE